MVSESDITEMGSVVEQLKEVEIELAVELSKDEVVQYIELRDDVPEELLKDAWRGAVKDQLSAQHDNKDQLIQQLQQQGMIDTPEENGTEPDNESEE